MVKQIKATAKPKAKSSQKQPAPLTFMDHVHELRSRLFWVALWFVVASGAVFPFFNDVIKLLMRPLGNQKLYYLTPVGGLSFAFKVCMYVGLIATLPLLIYHLYRFIAPVMRRHNARHAIMYVILSFLLAVSGIVFAYTVSLPAAVHFLTNFGIAGVSPMLTVDSYLSFIISYLLSGALLFQLPLIMLIIDSIKPTPPSAWGKFERHMVVAAFVIAMLITPTPNISDQVMMAAPMIMMYQVGIGLVWLRHHSKRHARKSAPAPVVTAAPVQPAPLPAAPAISQPPKRSASVVVMTPTEPNYKSMDFKRPAKRSPISRVAAPTIVVPARTATSRLSTRPRSARNIDGVIVNYTT